MDDVTKTVISCGQIMLSGKWIDNEPPSKKVISHVVLELRKLSLAKNVDMNAVYRDLVQKFHGGQVCAKNNADGRGTRLQGSRPDLVIFDDIDGNK